MIYNLEKKKANGEEDGEEDDSNLMKEWETHMHDFVPSDLLTYEVPSKGKEVIQPLKIRFFLKIFKKYRH